MRLVDDEQGTVHVAERLQFAQRRAVAVHREDGVGDEELAPRRCLEQPLDGGEVAVREDLDPRFREPAAVDQRSVVERVGEDQILRSGEDGNDGAVGRVAAVEEHRRFGACESGQRPLQLVLRKEIAADEAARPRARAPLPRALRESLGHPRVAREPEVIV